MKAIPTLEERHPLLQGLYQERDELQARWAGTTARKVVVSKRIRDNPNPGNAETNRLKRLLNQPTEPEIPPDHDLLPQLVREIELLNQAIEAIDKRIQKEKYVASKMVCKVVSGEHTALAKNFAKKVIELHGAHEQYVQFLDAVEDSGASLTPLRPVSPYTLGHPKSTNGTYWWSLREFLDNGHIQKHDFPESLR